MNNSPGWASPGSSPSDEPGRGPQEQPTPADAANPAGTPDSADAGPAPSEPGSGTPSSETQAAGTPGPEVPDDRRADQPQPSEQQPTDQQPSVQWAKEQPPTGQWSAPAGGPQNDGSGWNPPTGPGPQGTPGGQPGWGGQQAPGNAPYGNWGPPGGSGWGGAWAPPPPAAKPGVIPLRPLGISEILDGAVATMRAHWRTMLGISLVVAVITQAVSTVVTGMWFQDADALSMQPGANPSVDDALRDALGSLASSGIAWFIGMLGTVIATALITIVVSRAVLGRSVSAGEAWQDSRRQLPRLFGLLVLLPLIVLAVILVGLAPGIIVAATAGSAPLSLALALLGGLAAMVAAVWLWIRYCLAAPSLMLEKQGVITSMRRSAKLVRGAWWRVLGIQLLTALIVMIVEFIVQIPATIVAFLLGGDSAADWLTGESATTGWTFLIVIGIGAVISSTVTFPISAGVTALLYMDQRIRREALDLELARAAGLPGYGADGATAHGHTPGS